MAIQIRRGLQADLNAQNLLEGEPAFCTDTLRLLIGNGEGETVEIPALTQDLSGNGYVKLSSGLIIQWGEVIVNSEVAFEISPPWMYAFPEPFPNVCASMVGQPSQPFTYNGYVGFVQPVKLLFAPGVETELTHFSVALMGQASMAPAGYYRMSWIAIGY